MARKKPKPRSIEDMISARAAEAIRTARMARGFTMQQLADRLGVSLSMASFWESGSRGLTMYQLCALNKALGMKLAPEDVLTQDQVRRLNGVQG